MLTKEQKTVLEEIFGSSISKIATWGGGTALSENYLKHRQSEDIDIILTDLLEATELTILTNQIKNKLGATHKESFPKRNRFQYVFILKDAKQLKVEFIYYPFPKLEKAKRIGKIKIESLKDIATSKALSAYQRAEVKDAFDLYFLLKEKYFTLEQLIKGVEEKFYEKIDPPTLVARLSDSLKNYDSIKPILLRKVSGEDLEEIFKAEFNKLARKHRL